MEKKKIIIFLSQAIDERNLKRFGYYSLKKKFQVQFLDLSGIFNKRIKKTYVKKNEKNKNDNSFVIIDSYFQLLSFLKKIKKIYFVDCTTNYSVFFGLIQQYLILTESKKIHVTSATLPKEIHMSKKNKLIDILFRKKSILNSSIISFMLNYLNIKISKIFYPIPNYAFISGLKEKFNYPSKTKIFYSHCFDYDLFLKENKKKINSKISKNAVFINCITFDHPELYINKTYYENPVEKKYYFDLKRFFYNLNKKFNYKIVIALHPRANFLYKKKIKKIFKENYFKIVEGNTAKFIKKTKLVITHNSSAIQLGILWKKPIIFCHHDKMSNYEKKYIKGLAFALKKESYNIEKNNFTISKKDLNVIDKHYNNYIKNYIQSSKKSKTSSWDKFSDLS